MTGLVAFLQARLDELERTVVAEHGGPGFFWASGDRALTTEVPITGPDGQVWPQWRDVPPKAVFWLADIKAKRQILDLHTHYQHLPNWPEQITCGICHSYGHEIDYGVGNWCETVRALAAPFAGHPDFDPAWVVPMS